MGPNTMNDTPADKGMTCNVTVDHSELWDTMILQYNRFQGSYSSISFSLKIICSINYHLLGVDCSCSVFFSFIWYVPLHQLSIDNNTVIAFVSR